jgi:glutamine synthetase
MKSASMHLFNNYSSLRTLPQHNLVIAEYVWIDGTGINLRSKSRTLSSKVKSLEELPEWNYDGSSTLQAETSNSEVILKPVSYYRDPFRGGDNIIVLCETYKYTDSEFKNREPANTNFRYFANQLYKLVEEEHPQFGIE